jgi:hypothetical protein
MNDATQLFPQLLSILAVTSIRAGTTELPSALFTISAMRPEDPMVIAQIPKHRVRAALPV